MNQTEKTPKALTTMDGNTLMAQAFASLQFPVEKILPHGLSSLQAVQKSASHGCRSSERAAIL